MTRHAVAETATYEQTLLTIIRTLPIERTVQIIDFARYVQSQTVADVALVEGQSEEVIQADEDRWDAQFAATQEGLQAMASQVRAAIRAGQTQGMGFTFVKHESVCQQLALQARE